MLEKKSIVIYKSKSGFTKQYAKWIQEEVDCDVVDYKHIKKLKLENYDVIIYGSRVYAGKLDSVKKVIKVLENNQHSKLVIFATGGTPNEATEIINTSKSRDLMTSTWKISEHQGEGSFRCLIQQTLNDSFQITGK